MRTAYKKNSPCQLHPFARKQRKSGLLRALSKEERALFSRALLVPSARAFVHKAIYKIPTIDKIPKAYKVTA
ncbi:hypothetical protein [Bartonella tribocorum]|uniref:hypothetical protein n=1 Tax=Bartonella tribocorum TaxID=85701 RepID=UPI00056E87C8|nr:hypothetical protein [Bartonella tribocorum]